MAIAREAGRERKGCRVAGRGEGAQREVGQSWGRLGQCRKRESWAELGNKGEDRTMHDGRGLDRGYTGAGKAGAGEDGSGGAGRTGHGGATLRQEVLRGRGRCSWKRVRTGLGRGSKE